jgi:hypothetical protein
VEPQHEELFASLQRRRRPEDIAALIGDVLSGKLTRPELKVLDKARKGSLRQNFWGYTSMAQDFVRPVGVQRQVSKAQELFTQAGVLTVAQCDDPEYVLEFVQAISSEIGKTVGSNSFKYDRLNRNERSLLGLEHSRRQYNKKFRLLCRLEDKVTTLAHECKKFEMFQVAKRGLAHRVLREEFFKTDNTACFIAYYAARAGLRSEFTIYGQQRAFDEIAKMLLERCERERDKAGWWAIAHVLPTQAVLRNLTEERCGELLGIWFGMLQELAQLLEQTWESSQFDRASMIVARGNDSSTWNTLAGAWNRAREHWFALLRALELDHALNGLCPGKVMRLMAADVAAWHRSAGGKLHPDTVVWTALPLPWDVLTRREACTRSDVEQACRNAGVDAEKSGWVGPRPSLRAVAFRLTPELVHGVSVSNTYLADWLRCAGAFSGKRR